MVDSSFWESRMIVEFVRREKRARYSALLKDPKHRQKILERLNHQPDFDESLATNLTAAQGSHIGLMKLLLSLRVAPTCYLMADGNNLDGLELRLEIAIEEFLHSHWGAVLICPPRPIAVYKEESPGRMLLLQPKAT